MMYKSRVFKCYNPLYHKCFPNQFVSISKVVQGLPEEIQEELSEKHGGLLNYAKSNKEWIKIRYTNNIPEMKVRGDFEVPKVLKTRLKLHIPSFGIPLKAAAEVNNTSVSEVVELVLAEPEKVVLVDNPSIYTSPQKPSQDEFMEQLFIVAGPTVVTSLADSVVGDSVSPPENYNICRLARSLHCEAFTPISEVVRQSSILTEPLLPILLTPRFEIQWRPLPDSVKPLLDPRLGTLVKRVTGVRFKCEEKNLRPDLRHNDLKELLAELEEVKERLRLGTLHFLRGKDRRQALFKRVFHTKFPLGTPFLDDDVLYHAIFDVLEDQTGNTHVAVIRDKLARLYGDSLPVFKDTFFFGAPELLSAHELNKGGVVVGRTDVVGFKQKDKKLSRKEVLLEVLSGIRLQEAPNEPTIVNTSNLLVHLSKHTRKEVGRVFGSIPALLKKFPDIFEEVDRSSGEVLFFKADASRLQTSPQRC